MVYAFYALQISSKNVLRVQGCDAVAAIGTNSKLYKVPCAVAGHAPAETVFDKVLPADMQEIQVLCVCACIPFACAVWVTCSFRSFVRVGHAARPFCFIQAQRA
jgi:hypothetical protein